MARKKLAKYDPENGHLIEERDLTLKNVDDLLFKQAAFFGSVTQRNEPDGSLTGEVYTGEYDTIPAYKYKITFPK